MPSDWKKYKLEQLVNYINGGAWPANYYKETGIPVVRVSDVKNGRVDLSDCKYLDHIYIEKYSKHRLSENDLIICTVGSHPDQQSSVVGGVGIVSKEIEGAYLNQNAVLLRTIDSKLLSQKWLGYLGKSPILKNHIESEARGSANQVRIAISNLLTLHINLPPLVEQQGIAEILSSLDDKIELNLQTNKTLEEMANALYKHWFVDFSPFKDEKFVESELGLIPAGWEVKPLRDIVDVVNGFAFKGTDFIDEGVPVLKIKNVKAGKVIFKEVAYVSKEVSEKALKAKINYQDILITMTGNRMDGTPETWVGKSAMFLKETGDYFLNQRVSKIKIKTGSNFSKYFLSIMLSSEEFQHYFISNSTSSGGQANIAPDLIYNIKTIAPKMEVFNSFDEIISNWTFLKCANEAETEVLKQTRDYLLPKLISGEIRVKEAIKKVKEVL